jgi:two-component system, NtrC family, sensor kinase
VSLVKMTKLSWIYDLYLLSQSALAEEDPSRVAGELMKHIVSGFDAQSGSLALCDEVLYDRLVIVAAVDLPAHVIGTEVTLGDGVLGWVAQQGKALLLQGDIGQDPRFSNLQSRTESAIPCSALCWPLRLKDRIVGIINVNRAAGNPPFTEEDLEHGGLMVNLLTLAVDNTRLHAEQQRRIAALAAMNETVIAVNSRLEEAQHQLLQSEKMASIGQLAAGVAHEINNPIGFVHSNLGSLDRYVKDMFSLFSIYENAEASLDPKVLAPIQARKEEIDLKFVREDVFTLISESRDGITRVKKIVQDLKDFSHIGSTDEWQLVDLHAGIDSTLNIVQNEIKYKAEVIKDYAKLPQVECLPSQLNQVFMNMLINAAQAISERGVIAIRSGIEADRVWLEFSDTGKGIAAENLNRIFDPFFTTKPVGKGTGLGLSLSYGIIQKHAGKIDVRSEVGVGTTFRITLPVRRTAVAIQAAA